MGIGVTYRVRLTRQMKIFNFSAATAGLAIDTIAAAIVKTAFFLLKILFMILPKLVLKDTRHPRPS
jgi:hypothetical protein